MTPFYTEGLKCAFAHLGLKYAQASDERKGTPFTEQSSNIPAEQLAQVLQQEEDFPMPVRPDNTTSTSWNKAISWGSPKDLTGIENGMGGVTGMMTPMNPRS